LDGLINKITMKRNLLIGGLLIIDVFILLWSLNYLISYSAQDKLGSIAFGIIFSTAFYSINSIIIMIIKDK
jgi:hypothetical protein